MSEYLICYEYSGGFGHGYVSLDSLTHEEIENVVVPKLIESINRDNGPFHKVKKLIIRSITKLDE